MQMLVPNKRVYIASSVFNYKQVIELYALFENKGLVISYDWARQYEKQDENQLDKYAHLELNGVKSCDIFVYISPGRYGSATELGVALATNKDIVLVGDKDHHNIFYHLVPNQNKITMEELLNGLKSIS